MSKTQHKFPNNWSQISSKYAVDHINYLLEHYKDYRIQRKEKFIVISDKYFLFELIKDDKSFCIGDAFNCELRYFYRAQPGDMAYYPLKQLFEKCEQEIKIKGQLFPDDWSNLTDAKVQKNLSYIIRNFDKYSVKKIQGDKYLIGDNITIDIEWKDLGYKQTARYYIINNKRISLQNEKAGKLYKKCKKEPRKTFEEWWKEARGSIALGVGCASVVLIGFIVSYYQSRQERLEKEIDEQVEEYAKTLPNYKEYEQVKSLLQYYRDSLECAKK